MSLAQQSAEIFRRRYRREAEAVAIAPGRANLLGEHVDYNDGVVLPAAIARGVAVAAARREDGLVAIHAADLDDDVLFRIKDTAARTNAAGGKIAGWALYPAGVAHVIASRGAETSGIEAVVTSDLPSGAGLSSSAALEVAFARVWRALGTWAPTDLELALACVETERTYVGVECGVMDQVASACGRVGFVLDLDCRSLEHTTLALPSASRVVVADTGVRRELAVSAYNTRRAECAEAVKRLSAVLPNVEALRDVSGDDLDRHAAVLTPTLLRRARHVVDECARVQRGVEALARGRVEDLGTLMVACHESLRTLYEVSCPELDAMVEAACNISGCYGARLTGAGFGGSVVALVSREALDAGFAAQLARRYAAATGRNGNVFACV